MKAYIYARPDGSMTAILLAETVDHAIRRFGVELPTAGYPDEALEPTNISEIGIHNMLVLEDE